MKIYKSKINIKELKCKLFSHLDKNTFFFYKGKVDLYFNFDNETCEIFGIISHITKYSTYAKIKLINGPKLEYHGNVDEIDGLGKMLDKCQLNIFLCFGISIVNKKIHITNLLMPKFVYDNLMCVNHIEFYNYGIYDLIKKNEKRLIFLGNYALAFCGRYSKFKYFKIRCTSENSEYYMVCKPVAFMKMEKNKYGIIHCVQSIRDGWALFRFYCKNNTINDDLCQLISCSDISNMDTLPEYKFYYRKKYCFDRNENIHLVTHVEEHNEKRSYLCCF